MKKRVLSMLFIAMTMIACSSDDSSSMEDDLNQEVDSALEKNDFEVVYTQKGDLDESIIIFNILGANDGFVASSIIDKTDNKDLGNTPFLSMHEKNEGTHSYQVKDKVQNIMITVTSTVNEGSNEDLEIEIQVLKDGKEVYSQNNITKIGESLNKMTFTVD